MMYAILKTEAGSGAVEFAKVPVPQPSRNEVLIKVKAAALCGTDLHIAHWSSWAQNAGLTLPLVLGHECAGIVEAVGSDVSTVKVGDRVASETHIPCGFCLQCQIGEQHICANLKLFGVHINGCFAEYAVLPALCARKLPTEISFAAGAVLEPLGTAFRAVMEAHVAAKSVVISGCGPIGLFAVGAAAMMGAAKVIAVDISKFRLDAAKAMGATEILLYDEKETASRILELTDGCGVDAIIEASGDARAITGSFDYLRKGGRIALIGLPGQPVTVEIGRQIVFKEAKVFGIHGRKMFETWRYMENALMHRKLDISSVLSHQLKMVDFQEAFALAGKGLANKVILTP